MKRLADFLNVSFQKRYNIIRTKRNKRFAAKMVIKRPTDKN